jgi:hypothetical protein
MREEYPVRDPSYRAPPMSGRHNDLWENPWTFSQTIADVAPEDWGGTSRRL